MGNRVGDGALGDLSPCASGLALAQSTVQLTVDIWSKHTGRAEGLRVSRCEGMHVLDSIT